jgi:hypothetical protein
MMGWDTVVAVMLGAEVGRWRHHRPVLGDLVLVRMMLSFFLL